MSNVVPWSEEAQPLDACCLDIQTFDAKLRLECYVQIIPVPVPVMHNPMNAEPVNN